MKKVYLLSLLIAIILASCLLLLFPFNNLSSPDRAIRVKIDVTDDGIPYYFVKYHGTTVIDTSYLGFKFSSDTKAFSGFEITDRGYSLQRDEPWEMPWGEQRTVEDDYNGMKVVLRETEEPFRTIKLEFKAYNDGIGFRYILPEQEGLRDLIILDENTEFNLKEDNEVWWIPGDWDIYEHLYSHTKLSEIDALKFQVLSGLAQTYIPYNAVNTPVTMKTKDGYYLSFHEANLTDYPGMTLKVDTIKLKLTSELVGNSNDIKGFIKTPFKTPWRTIQIADKAGDLIKSKMILNLNEPAKFDVSWFKPTKYMGIWWDMHIGTKSWDYASGRHGATTEYAKKYIDFCAENGIGALLVEGWNTGWEHWFGDFDREGIFDFVTPYPDYDLKEVVAYGKSKGVEIIMHHETSAAPRTYAEQMDTAYALMNELGISTVKTGYVGKIIPKGEYHHGQWMVNQYRLALTKAAAANIAINAHEPIKDTGIRRTYPNAISREGMRGQEFNAWSPDGGNPPNHLPTVAFTRMLAGPFDFTPGIFNIKLKPYKPNNQINTTLAQQLALYVVIYSPVQMVPDLIENYEGQPAFQFIRDVGVDWDETRVLDGEVGEFVTIVRKERDTDNWFLGSITNEDQRRININCDFLNKGKKYTATIYSDAKDAHWDKNPTDYQIDTVEVYHRSDISLNLAPGGGCAISFFPSD
ncbi:MAG: glycoside hydrolase family 97 protein [Candidatus Marinimicrobia bacterium]|nr:glycoside hydrolase family 97 protein [Candidatus Neomarinimicrobiota bacterium]